MPFFVEARLTTSAVSYSTRDLTLLSVARLNWSLALIQRSISIADSVGRLEGLANAFEKALHGSSSTHTKLEGLLDSA